MAHTRTWSNTTPADGDALSAGAGEIRNHRVDVDERMSLEHKWADSTTYDGTHIPGKCAVVENQSTAATIIANAGDFLAAYNGSIAIASDTLVAYVKVGTEYATNGTWTANAASHTTNSNYVIEGATSSLPVSVYSGTPGTTWVDLDLSAEVGSRRALVFLRVVGTTSAGYCTRRNGDSVNVGQNDTNYAAGASAVSLAINNQGYLLIETDASGIIEHKCLSAAHSVVVYLVGFIG